MCTTISSGSTTPISGSTPRSYIANKDYTYAQCVAAGANPTTTPSTGAQMDTITEVDQSGTIVWEWDFFDHLIQDQYPTEGNYAGAGQTPANYPGKLDIDLPGHPLKDDWLHCNSLDFNQSLDQIVINSVQGEFYVIDHGGTIVAGNPTASIAKAATTAGDFLYRFGDPARYGQGTTPSISGITSSTGTKQLGGAHDIQWIAAGLPGAGDFLIFNNAEYLSQTTPQSYVEEINPYLNSSGVNTGSYVNPPDAGYNTVTSPAVDDKSPMLISKQVVWDWSSQSNLSMMYNDIGGSAQRLPNGNTLICSDVWGYITEVTPANKTVWDYIVPVVAGTGPVLTLGDRLPYDNSIFRAYRYGFDRPHHRRLYAHAGRHDRRPHDGEQSLRRHEQLRGPAALDGGAVLGPDQRLQRLHVLLRAGDHLPDRHAGPRGAYLGHRRRCQTAQRRRRAGLDHRFQRQRSSACRSWTGTATSSGRTPKPARTTICTAISSGSSTPISTSTPRSSWPTRTRPMPSWSPPGPIPPPRLPPAASWIRSSKST